MMFVDKRSHMVELYLSGRMSAADERRFQHRLAGDPALQRLLQQEQEILQALHRDKAAIPLAAAGGFERLLQESRLPGNEGRGDGFQWRSSGDSGINPSAGFLNGSSLMIVAILVVLGLSAGAFLFWKSDEMPEKALSPSPAAVAPANNARQHSGAGESEGGGLPSAGAQPASDRMRTGVPPMTPPESVSGMSAPAIADPSSRGASAAAPRSEIPSAAATSRNALHRDSTGDMNDYLLQQERNQTMDVVRDDTLKTRLRLNQLPR